MKFRIHPGGWIEVDGQPEEVAVVVMMASRQAAAIPVGDAPLPRQEMNPLLTGAPAKLVPRNGHTDEARPPIPPPLSPTPAPDPRATASPSPRVEVKAPPPLSSYPPALQEPRAETQRRVYDALKDGARTPTEIAKRITLTSMVDITDASVMSALQHLRNKSLAYKADGYGGEWRLTTEV